MILLEIQDLTKDFGGLRAVAEVSLQLTEGQILAIIGPNGAGKSTVFNMITGLLPASRGQIHFRGQKINGMRPHEITALGIGRTFQNVRLFKNLSVLQNVLAGSHCRSEANLLGALLGSKTIRLDWIQAQTEAQELLKLFKLPDAKDAVARFLPYGQQRLLEIARAMASDPVLLCLDEPAAGLNLSETRQLKEIILALRYEMGKTILIIEHDMKLVMEIADWIIVLDHGRKIAEGIAKEVQNDSKVIEAYLGSGFAEAYAGS